MGERLTEAQRKTLVALDCCTERLDARNRSNKLLLAALGRKGLASYRFGYPTGWMITPAGRSLLKENPNG